MARYNLEFDRALYLGSRSDMFYLDFVSVRSIAVEQSKLLGFELQVRNFAIQLSGS